MTKKSNEELSKDIINNAKKYNFPIRKKPKPKK